MLRKRALPKRGPGRVLCGHEGATAPFSIANNEKQDPTPATKRFGLRGSEAEAEEDVRDLLLVGSVAEHATDPLRDRRDWLRGVRDDQRDLRVEAGRAAMPRAIGGREVEALARRVSIAIVCEEHDVAGVPAGTV